MAGRATRSVRRASGWGRWCGWSFAGRGGTQRLRGLSRAASRDRVAVAFDEPPPDWATAGRVSLELVPSPVTWERLSAGLRRVAAAEGNRWHAVLSGETPRFLPRPRGPALPTSLAPEQEAALDLADRALDVALVHGPPGTGKTTVLVEVIRRAAARGEKVLAAAPSNLAADNLLQRLVAAGVDGVRVGHPARVVPALLDRTLEARVEGHEAVRIAQGLVDEALSSARRAQAAREAGAGAVERGAGRRAAGPGAARRGPAARGPRRAGRARPGAGGGGDPHRHRRAGPLGMLLRARRRRRGHPGGGAGGDPGALRADRAVLAGDHLQLPPTAISVAAAAGGLGVSLFERLAAAHGEAIMATLLEQRRMNEAIMHFPSRAMYGGRLRAHPSVAGWKLDEEPLLFVDTAGTGFEEGTPEGSDSRHNEGEAALVAREVERVLALGVTPGDVAVISPYDAQVQRLRQVLAARVEQGLEVDSVDGFQGREKEAVVVSLVRSNDLGEVGFLSDVRRMNVAITRARKKLVVVGDSATVARHPFYESFVRHAQETGAWVSAFERE